MLKIDFTHLPPRTQAEITCLIFSSYWRVGVSGPDFIEGVSLWGSCLLCAVDLVSIFYLVLAEASSPVPTWLCKCKVPGCSDDKCPKHRCGCTIGFAFHFPDPSFIPHPRVSSSFLSIPPGIYSSTSHTVLSISRCFQVKVDSLKNYRQSKSACLFKKFFTESSIV